MDFTWQSSPGCGSPCCWFTFPGTLLPSTLFSINTLWIQNSVNSQLLQQQPSDCLLDICPVLLTRSERLRKPQQVFRVHLLFRMWHHKFPLITFFYFFIIVFWFSERSFGFSLSVSHNHQNSKKQGMCDDSTWDSLWDDGQEILQYSNFFFFRCRMNEYYTTEEQYAPQRKYKI